MNTEMVTVRNRKTRKVGKMLRIHAEHPLLGKGYEIVPDGTKTFVELDELVDKKRSSKPKSQETPEQTDEKDEVEA